MDTGFIGAKSAGGSIYADTRQYAGELQEVNKSQIFSRVTTGDDKCRDSFFDSCNREQSGGTGRQCSDGICKGIFSSDGIDESSGKRRGLSVDDGEIRYLDEVYAAVQNLEKDFCQVGEVEQIFRDALEYWQVLRQRMQNEHRSIADREYRIRVRKIIRTPAELYKSITGIICVSDVSEASWRYESGNAVVETDLCRR